MLTFINEPVDLSDLLGCVSPTTYINSDFFPIHTYVVGDGSIIPNTTSVCVAVENLYCQDLDTLVLSINDEKGLLSGFLGLVATARKLHFLDKIRFLRREKLRLSAYEKCYKNEYIFFEDKGVAHHSWRPPVRIKCEPNGQFFLRDPKEYEKTRKVTWIPL